ncbi:MAG: Smr/MutS family protein [Sphingomonadaceae bacterium]
MSRRLTPEEEAIWQRVAATVHAYRPQPEAAPAIPPPAPARPLRDGVGAVRGRVPSALPARAAAPARHAETLDTRWDRRLASARTRPDRVIDLHGMTRAAARQRLREAILLGQASGGRLVLVITGKGDLPGPEPMDLMADRPVRGAIRAELPRWLGEADISPLVAAVRQASSARGGLGAVWLVLRRRKAG